MHAKIAHRFLAALLLLGRPAHALTLLTVPSARRATAAAATTIRLQQQPPPPDEGAEVRPDALSIGEKVSRGVKDTWVNPGYWNRQYVSAAHVSNNVPNGSRVLELGKDAKNLHYLREPTAVTLIVPPSNVAVEEGPIRGAAAKLNTPFSLYTERPLDTIPINPATFDAALCFDMLDGAPAQVLIPLPS